MSRMHRIEIPKTIYHVISRGNNKNAIFLGNKDYAVFLKHLFEVKSEKDFSLYAYCLMPNHFHLLIESIQEPLSKIMQKLLTQYAIYFNHQYDKSGHVFQGRYKALICEKEEYLFKLIQYIHVNPLHAGLTKDLNNYTWSSHSVYMGKNKNKYLSLEGAFRRLDCRSLAEGYKVYRNLISEYINKKHPADFNLKPDKKTLLFKEFSLSEILDKIHIQTKISKDVIVSESQSPKINQARKKFAYMAQNDFGYTLKEIADFLNKDPSVVSKYIKDIKQNLDQIDES